MEDEASILLDGKALGNLRVVDLKQELEKRGLSKSGSKKDLVKRLKQQLEFEKLCGERKTTGDDKVKLELDADTEQNEFVQQYLAQQQKIYAEQKEVKRLIELEEIQRSSDERGSDSPKAEDASDQDTHPEESSDNESQTEEKAPVMPDVRPRGRRKIVRESSEERTETVLAPVADKQTSEKAKLKTDEKLKDNSLNSEVAKDQVTKREVTVRKNEDEEDSTLNAEPTKDFETKHVITIRSKEHEEVSSVDIEPAKIIETKHDTTVKRKEHKKVSSGNVEEKSTEKDSKIEERKISSVFSEGETVSKESGSEEILKKDISSVTDDDKSRIQVSKDDLCVVDEKKNKEVIVENIQDISNASRTVEDTKGKNLDNVGDIEDKNIEVSNVQNIEDKNVEVSKDESIECENMIPSRIEDTEDENMNTSKIKNIDEENAEVSSTENIEVKRMDMTEVERTDVTEGERMDVTEVEKMNVIEVERMDVTEVERMDVTEVERTDVTEVERTDVTEVERMDVTKVESMDVVEVEGTKVSGIKNIENENVKMSRIENIESENVAVSTVETVQKIETDVKTVDKKDDKNEKSVSTSSSSVDHEEKIQKLSEKTSIEEKSLTLKNNPSSLDSSETVELPTQDQSSNMEPATEISSVPYSVSDIQLPESPGSGIKKSVSKSIPGEISAEQPVEESKTPEAEGHANGTDSNSSNEGPASDEQTSESKTASNLNGGESPKKEETKASSRDAAEREKKDSSASKDCKEEGEEHPKSSKYSEGSEEGEMKSDSESATEESSDSHEHRRGRRKPRKVKRKGDQRRKSGSSDSSRSQESSPDKRQKIDTEASDKAVPVKEGAVSPRASAPAKQRLKLKRDNVVVSDSVHTAKKNSSVSQASDESSVSNRKHSDVVMQSETSEPSKTEPVEAPKSVPKYVSTRKIRLTSRKLSEKSEDEPKSKKGKWGNFSSSQKSSQAISISTNSLKNWFPDFKLLKNPESVNEVVFDDAPLPIKEESHRDLQADRMDESSDFPLNAGAVKDDPKASEPAADPLDDGGQASNILFIQNLVRPFTLLQLKELLKETGKFSEEKFWIDKIKSKCFVTYETEEEAVKTRNTLNGSRWPSSNPKILSVEFATEEDLQFHQSGSEPPKLAPLPPPSMERSDSREDRTAHPAPDFRKKEPERRRERTKLPVREWDKNKLTQESPTRERTSKSAERLKASSDKREKKDAKRRPNEDTPAKLLDDLFQKTKSSPCIYWLPLTEEQVLEKEESLRLRRVEREKRNQQREQEDNEHKNKSAQSRNRTREMETRRSSTRSRSPVSRRR